MQISREEISILQQLRHRIHCGIFSRVNIDTFIAPINLSPRNISEKFTFLFQYSINDYYNVISMEYARALLSDYRSVKEVAVVLGFRSVSQFSKTFLRLMRKPPSAYNRNNSAGKFAENDNRKSLAK